MRAFENKDEVRMSTISSDLRIPFKVRSKASTLLARTVELSLDVAFVSPSLVLGGSPPSPNGSSADSESLDP